MNIDINAYVCWDSVLFWIQWSIARRKGEVSPFSFQRLAKENGFIEGHWHDCYKIPE